MNEPNSCIFCKIASKEIETNIIYEDKDVIAFNDLVPQAPIHILVIPKKHFKSLPELNNKELTANLFSAVNKIIQLKNIKDFRTIINTGSKAGQTVFHLHIHILSGRNFSWPPG